jgi:hypothetical protein
MFDRPVAIVEKMSLINMQRHALCKYRFLRTELAERTQQPSW